jgi:hypothetical protein
MGRPPRSSKSLTQPFISFWDPLAGAVQLNAKGRGTSVQLRRSAMPAEENALPLPLLRKSPIPQSDQIPIWQLAQELDIDPERAYSLIENGYLRVIQPEPMKDAIVARPAPAAMEWLRQMFLPLRMRPMIPTEMVALFLEMNPSDVRALCLDHNVHFIDDPVFGELLSITAFHHLHALLYRMRDPMRFDRQSLLSMLVHIQKIKAPDSVKNHYIFSTKIEQEIKRIADLPEPERTFHATELLQCYDDAAKTADMMVKNGGGYKYRRLDNLIDNVRKILETVQTQQYTDRAWDRIKRYDKKSPGAAIPRAKRQPKTSTQADPSTCETS